MMVTDLWTLMFSFRGRINRAKYWLSILLFAAIWLVGLGAFFIPFDAIGIPIGIAVIIAGFATLLAASVKRLHDRDKSAWYLFLFYLVPGVLEGFARTREGIGLVLPLLAGAISLWAAIELGFLRGTVGPNQYGPDSVEDIPGQTGLTSGADGG
jgi:uncharacterized membrane protein YhaH (DUF805 family)